MSLAHHKLIVKKQNLITNAAILRLEHLKINHFKKLFHKIPGYCAYVPMK